MQRAVDQFSLFVMMARARHLKQMRFALVVAALVALLLWQTQWFTLRPALLLLLIGQVGTAAILFNRRMALAKKVDSEDEAGILAWFDAEAAFVKYSALFENGVRTIGLMVLAYGFWVATRNLWVALALGVLYPVSAYFGLARKSASGTIAQLEMQKNEIRELLKS